MFFIADENGKEITLDGDSYNFFASFKAAKIAAIKYSKNHTGKYFVSCCVPGTMYENGKEV